MNRSARLAGVGQTVLGKHPDTSSRSLMAEAARYALNDAGLSLRDVDGIVTTPTRTDLWMTPSVAVAEYLGVQPRYAQTVVLGGASGVKMVMDAAAAVESGAADVVLVVAGEPRLTGFGSRATLAANAQVGHPDFEVPLGAPIPSMYAMVASAYMDRYAVTSEQLAAVAVATRDHASRAPFARFQEPITIDDVMTSTPIADPLHKLDCVPVADGAGAVVVTSADRSPSGVRILGAGESSTFEHIVFAEDLTSFGARTSSAHAYAAAGLGPHDVDVALIYDCFTVTVLINLEDLGLCGRGEAGSFVSSGEIGLDGSLPTNTHGGLLSGGQPGASGGLFHVIEGVRQIEGKAEARQVDGAGVALVHGLGGVFASHATILLGGAT